MSVYQQALAQLDGPDGLGWLIEHLEATPVDSWQTDVVRSEDGSKNCLFGHLFQIGEEVGGGEYANALWTAFEESWATTYVIYPINDGNDPRYRQDSAKERVLAYLSDLRERKYLPTDLSMDATFLHCILEDDPRPFTQRTAKLIDRLISNLTGHPAWTPPVLVSHEEWLERKTSS